MSLDAGTEMTDRLTLPDGTPIAVRPIVPQELDRIPLRCWPERETLDRLFADQGTIGMAAWEGDKCVGQLHCYRLVLPDGTNENWPQWSDWWAPISSGLGAARKAGSQLVGPAWCHACFHVGRTLETFCMEMLRKSVLPQARKNHWGDRQIIREVRKHIANISEEMVLCILDDARSPHPTVPTETDARYVGRGIGTALCKESVRWAQEHDYVALIALGHEGPFEYTERFGALPWTTYARLGFKVVEGLTEQPIPEVVLKPMLLDLVAE